MAGRGSSRYFGVSWHKGRKKWAARIEVKGKRKSLGYHMDEQDAARAFDLAARKTRVGGKSTKLKLNFPRKGEVVAAGATSRFRGVSWLKARAKWHAQITINKKQTHLGCFTDEADAGRAYDAAARRYRNVEEDKLNFPHDTVAPHLLTSRAKPSSTASAYTGVSWCSPRTKWTATISIKGKETFLGNFKLEANAARAYDTSLRKHFGEEAKWLAKLNFPTKTEKKKSKPSKAFGSTRAAMSRGVGTGGRGGAAHPGDARFTREPLAWIDHRNGKCFDRRGRLISP